MDTGTVLSTHRSVRRKVWPQPWASDDEAGPASGQRDCLGRLQKFVRILETIFVNRITYKAS